MSWADVPGFSGYYEIHIDGRVRSLDRMVSNGRCMHLRKGQAIKTKYDKDGYPYVHLKKEGREKVVKIHRLLAEIHIPNPDRLPQVDHIDGDKTNHHLSNLRWCTNKQNAAYASDLGLLHGRSCKKLRKEAAKLYRAGMKKKPIAEKLGVTRHTVYRYLSIEGLYPEAAQ